MFHKTYNDWNGMTSTMSVDDLNVGAPGTNGRMVFTHSQDVEGVLKLAKHMRDEEKPASERSMKWIGSIPRIIYTKLRNRQRELQLDEEEFKDSCIEWLQENKRFMGH
jgi:hypothetical protein